jgi:hypothetical protein
MAPPRIGDATLHGSAILKVTIGVSGDIEQLSTNQASSPEFAAYVESLIQRMAPFEPLSAQMRKSHSSQIVKTSPSNTKTARRRFFMTDRNRSAQPTKVPRMVAAP